jgi:hypothetical protein
VKPDVPDSPIPTGSAQGKQGGPAPAFPQKDVGRGKKGGKNLPPGSKVEGEAKISQLGNENKEIKIVERPADTTQKAAKKKFWHFTLTDALSKLIVWSFYGFWRFRKR